MQKAAAAFLEELIKSRDQIDKGREENDAASKLREQMTNLCAGFLLFVLQEKLSDPSQILPPGLPFTMLYSALFPRNSSLLQCKPEALQHFCLFVCFVL